MREFYEDYWRDPEHADPRDDPDTALRTQLILEYIRARGGRTVLEMGCGTGERGRDLRAAGCSWSGMEISARAAQEARANNPGCSVERWSIEEEPWPWTENKFDVAIGTEVIEHLVRPEPLFRETRRVLRPGGLLILTTPFHGRIKVMALATKLDLFERHFCNLQSGHIRFYTDRLLRKLGAQYGFSPIRTVHYGRFWPLSRGVLIAYERS